MGVADPDLLRMTEAISHDTASLGFRGTSPSSPTWLVSLEAAKKCRECPSVPLMDWRKLRQQVGKLINKQRRPRYGSNSSVVRKEQEVGWLAAVVS
jgi:hypothetical protein